MGRLRRALATPVDGASLAAFRVLFGVVMGAALVRALTMGWVEEVLVQPDFFFKYAGAEWMPVWGPRGLSLHLGATALCALLVALGLFYRVAIVGFLVGFASLQLMDLTNYLNHYYLVVLLAALLAVMPAHRVASLDRWRRRAPTPDTVPRWCVALLRFQVGCVFVFAALAKATPDWLVHGQPLGIWLSSRGDVPVLGPLLVQPWAPLAMSWAGFLYDATIVGFLLWRRSRPFAYLAVLGFHGATALLFDIGMFPLIMVTATTIFFAPDWPRRLLRRPPARQSPALATTPLRAPALAALAAWCAFHVLFPLRAAALPGDVLWGEQGMRYAWKVLVRAKHGAVTFHVHDPADGRRFVVSPATYLEPRQESEMSGQPDLIHQLARHIAGDFARRGRPGVAVRAEAWVSLNGRPPALLLDPEVDLAALPPADLAQALEPAPTTAPLRAVARR